MPTKDVAGDGFEVKGGHQPSPHRAPPISLPRPGGGAVIKK
jgi:hypothetical protein